ncbi:sulfotransferase domain-containing protein [Candidatus Pelagibacter sp.]|nr:sulfotransferase domain-containing protein [Candidatus Pelagibacter sp.]
MIIWIASYPKSGNTWVRSFLSAYFFSKDGIFDVKYLKKIEDYPNKQFFSQTVKEGEIHNHWDESQKKIAEAGKVKFLKTHNSLIKAFGNDFTQPKYTLGVVYILRDPRNVITSVKNHNDFSTYAEALEFMQNDNAVLKDYKHLQNHAKTTIINSWRINYQSWIQNNFYRRMTIKYEDMMTNPKQIFRDLVVYVNTLCRFNESVNESKLENAIRSTSFDKLKNIENQGNFSESVYSLKDKRKIQFFFLGPQNDWKKKLDKSLINKMNDYYKEDLNKLGYEI